ncbi:MAG: transposase [Candidatus Dormibacteraceae bacterium]
MLRVGIDETAFRKGHKYLTVVVDHDTGHLVWAAEGRDEQTMEGFFSELGADAILATLVHGLTNARVESLNTRIKLIIRRGFGFHSAEPIIGLAMLTSAPFTPHYLVAQNDPRNLHKRQKSNHS